MRAFLLCIRWLGVTSDLKSSWRWLQALWQRLSRSDLGLISAGVAFFGFLALFPAIAAVISIWGFVFDPVAIRSQMMLSQDYLPAEAYDLISGQVERILASNNRRFGLATLVSTLLALWSARAGVSALIDGLNAIHGYPKRSGPRHVLRALSLTLVLIGVVMAAMAIAIVAPLVIKFLPLGPGAAFALKLANFTLGVLLVTAGIALSYRLGPNRPRHVRRPPILTKGLLIALVLWTLVARGLVYYFANFANYNQVYGSIGAVVALQFWFYLSAYVVLLGAAVDAETGKPDQ